MTTKSPLDGVLSNDDLLALAHQLIEAVLAAEHSLADPERSKAIGTWREDTRKVYDAADAVRAAAREAATRPPKIDPVDAVRTFGINPAKTEARHA